MASLREAAHEHTEDLFAFGMFLGFVTLILLSPIDTLVGNAINIVSAAIFGSVVFLDGFLYDLFAESSETEEASEAEDSVAVLRDRYARGEVGHEEFERRLDRLLASEDATAGSRTGTDGGTDVPTDGATQPTDDGLTSTEEPTLVAERE